MASIPSPERLQGQQPDDEYAMAAEPTAPAPSGGQRPTWWYVPRGTGNREGPVTLDLLKQRFSAGGLSPEDLVWREGMAEWVPARTVPEIGLAPRPAPAAGSTSPPSPTLPPFPQAPTARSRPSPSPAELLAPIHGFFGRPMLYHMIGWAALALCALWLLIALIVWLVSQKGAGSSAPVWFNGAILFALLFVAGHGIGAVLDKLDGQ